MFRVLQTALGLAKGNLFDPWNSEYLKWRIETYWGIPVKSLNKQAFLQFTWKHRAELWRYLIWAAQMRRQQ
jgi:hypothetical protein